MDILRILIGISIFIYGMISNIKCDNILRSLKKENSNEYKIPYGNLFNLVSSGHYLGEIIEW
jgi:steroid 5-alpha reductase family enzyme